MQSNVSAHFTTPLLAWFDAYGRKALPWQQPKTPYRVYVSEIMLQQTQVKTVIPYFERFMLQFPTIESLASASEDEVLSYWSGLGYYSSARHLHRTAQLIMIQHHGTFPEDLPSLQQLPGIGPSTAAAIASLAFGQSVAIFDGNVKRVLSRYFLVESPLHEKKTEKILMAYATACLSPSRCADYTQAIMDLGALCCRPKQPDCQHCPLKTSCLAYQYNRMENLPTKIKKKPLPTKSLQFLLIHRPHSNQAEGHEIHLEKRPHNGIWGSLWCLPSLTLDESIAHYMQKNFDSPCPSVQLFLTLKHTFTHFHLEMTVYLVPFIDTTKQLSWFSQSHLRDLGLPKPISQILMQFFSSVTSDTMPRARVLKG